MNEKVGGMKDKSMRRELRKIESEEKWIIFNYNKNHNTLKLQAYGIKNTYVISK